MPDTTHEGNDPMGAPTSHRGPLENCPAPDALPGQDAIPLFFFEPTLDSI